MRLVLALGVLAVAAGATWLLRWPDPQPILGALPSFTLTERSERAFGSQDLAGHVWVANFVFTRCPDFCPLLTSRMATLQPHLGPAADPIRLVSFSVDPVNDTPEALRAYATRAGAAENWVFLTGPRDQVATLLREGFRVAYADDGPPTSPITHSDRFVLVDRQLRIRGYYHGTDSADVARLGDDAAALLDEPLP
jgi:protein SCO1/2